MTSNRFLDSIDDMLWKITQRQLCKELNRIRWKKYYKPPAVMDSKTSNYRMFGVPKEEFIDTLWQEEFLLGLSLRNPFYFILSRLNQNLRPKYFEKFNPKVEDTLRKCIDEKYIDVLKNNRLGLSSRGGDLISRHYYIRALLRHPVMEHLIKWGAISFIVWTLARYGIEIGK